MSSGSPLPPGVELLAATREQQPVLMNLFELYAYDLSDVAGLHVSPDGRYPLPSLDRYWLEATRTPLLLKVDGHWGGFALVSQGSLVSGDTHVWDMAEFFVLRAYRRKGLGAATAHAIWRRFPGRWEIRVLETNAAALPFWQTAIDSFVAQHVASALLEQGGKRRWVFAFDSANR